MRNVLILLAAGFALSCNLLTDPEERCGGLGFGRPATLEGRLHYPDGRGVPNAELVLGMNAQTTTDADGRFRFGDVTAGTQQLTFVPAPSMLRGHLRIVAGRNYVDITMIDTTFSGWASGRVLDGCTGRPIAGAKVGHVFTNGDGTYSFFACCGSMPGQMVSKDGYSPQSFAIFRVSAHTYLSDFVLMPAK